MAEFAGFVEKSSVIVMPVLVKEPTGALTVPGSAPAYEVWNATIESTIASGNAVAVTTTATGIYRVSIDTSPASFAAGNSYFTRVTYTTTTSGVQNQEYRFTVV